MARGRPRRARQQPLARRCRMPARGSPAAGARSRRTRRCSRSAMAWAPVRTSRASFERLSCAPRRRPSAGGQPLAQRLAPWPPGPCRAFSRTAGTTPSGWSIRAAAGAPRQLGMALPLGQLLGGEDRLLGLLGEAFGCGPRLASACGQVGRGSGWAMRCRAPGAAPRAPPRPGCGQHDAARGRAGRPSGLARRASASRGRETDLLPVLGVGPDAELAPIRSGSGPAPRAPSSASARVSGQLRGEVRAVPRSKRGSGLTRTVMTRSPDAPPPSRSRRRAA